MLGFRMNDDGSLTMVPSTSEEAERLTAVFEMAQEHEDAIRSGDMTIGVALNMRWRSAEARARHPRSQDLITPHRSRKVIVAGAGVPITKG